MAASVTNGLLIGATLMGGLLAGLSTSKVLVQMPAFAEIGAPSWAAYARAADLGPGLLVYPAIGLGALCLTVAAALACALERSVRFPAAVPAYAAAILAIAALVVTNRFLVPPMLGLRQMGENAADLHGVFAHVARWWQLKATLHVLTFGANLWALVTVLPDAAAK